MRQLIARRINVYRIRIHCAFHINIAYYMPLIQVKSIGSLCFLFIFFSSTKDRALSELNRMCAKRFDNEENILLRHICPHYRLTTQVIRWIRKLEIINELDIKQYELSQEIIILIPLPFHDNVQVKLKRLLIYK